MPTIGEIWSAKDSSIAFITDREVEEIKAFDNRPLADEDQIPQSDDFGQSQISNSDILYESLYDYFKKSPEVIAPINTIISDIMSDGYYLENVDAGSGKKKIKRASDFLNRNQFKTRVQPNILYDSLVTGDGYLYKTKVTIGQVENVVDNVVDRFDLPTSKKKFFMSSIDEDTYSTKNLIALPSSTVEINHDKFGNVNYFIQRVKKGVEAKFTPDEIIHFKFMPLSGKVYGFSPMKAVVSELSLIGAIKDFTGYTFDNLGIPDFMFNMPDEVPGSINVRQLAHQLRRFKSMMNKHRSIVTTGSIKTEKLNELSKDMQYVELLNQMTRIVLMIWGVPPAKMGITSDKSGAYDSGLATEGYYRKIATHQDWLEEHMNNQLLIDEFGVELHYNRAYLQDEVRETQTLMQKFDIAQKAWENHWVKKDWIIKFLDIPDNLVGDFKTDKLSNTQRQNFLSNNKVIPENQQQEVDSMRKDTQNEHKENVKSALIEKGYYTKNEIEDMLRNELL